MSRDHHPQEANWRQSVFSLVCFALAMLISNAALSDDQWGSVRGRVVFEGTIPKRKVLQKLPDGVEVTDEHLLVDPQTRGLANVFVYPRNMPAERIHPDLLHPAKTAIEVAVKGQRFVPRAVVVRTGQPLRIFTVDGNTQHNIHDHPLRNVPGCRLAPASDPFEQAPYSLPERLPIQVTCSVHHWESAYWLIVDHPYATITNRQGEFTIEKFPTGAHELIFWHESYGYVSKLPVHVERDKPTRLKDIVAKELPPSKSP